MCPLPQCMRINKLFLKFMNSAITVVMMARVNTDILRISELKWTGMGERKSDDHYIYCCGQEFLRRKE